jgi:hypothetical protein
MMKTRLLVVISLIALVVFGSGNIVAGQNKMTNSGTVNLREDSAMYNVKADAVRKKGVVNVKISGDLPNSCYQAKIVDKYPGGNIKYIQDPGSAQVFIKETQKTTGFCPEALVPWKSQVKIPDYEHKEVSIFINDKLVTKTQVQMEQFHGYLFAKLASIGRKTEGPQYFLQQWDDKGKITDIPIQKKTQPWENDNMLHKYLAQKVIISGSLIEKNIQYEEIRNE